MKEKLIIKNFGPIKDVELELKRINILIGEQGTGKSSIGKILAIFNDDWFLQEPDFVRLLQFYNIDSYLNPNSEIEYENEFIKVSCKGDSNNNIRIEFMNSELGSLVESIRNTRQKWRDTNDETKETILDELIKIRTEFEKKYYVSKYIPSERTIIGSNDEVVKSRAESSIEGRFQYLLDFEKNFQSAKSAKKFTFLGNNFIKKEDVWYVVRDELDIRIKVASSGIQSVFPLGLVFGYNVAFYDKLFHVIEEPEQNLFPTSQYLLLKYLLMGSTLLSHKLLITTHSPYILSSLNNLMYAYEVGEKKEEKVNLIIPKSYWVNPAHVSAYRLMPDGTAKKIISESEDGILIEAEEIDEVSSEINKEFNELINIELGLENEKS